MPAWERWFGVDELQGLMQTNGVDADAEFIGHDEITSPDGLFVCWAGKKKATDRNSAADAPVLCANGRAAR
jgi:hypothetical protein